MRKIRPLFNTANMDFTELDDNIELFDFTVREFCIMLDRLRQIAIFAKTVDHGSFRGAAKALRLSPSVVSHHVSQLEDNLGVALIYRSTRKLSLTPDGERLLLSARAMVAAAEQGLQEVSSQTSQPSGTLRITLPAALAQSKLTEKLAAFSAEFYNVQVALDFSDVRRDLIGDGFDISIRMGWLEDSALKARKLFDVKRYLVATPKYIASKAKPVSPLDIRDWDWIDLSPVSHIKQEFQKDGKLVAISRPNSRLSVNDAHALKHLAVGSAGLAVIPDYLAEADIHSGILQNVLPDWSVQSVGVYAVWPSNAPKTGLVKSIVDYLAS